jgi:hypothetical protein
MTFILSAERDFISLFAAEPQVLDASVPWIYNTVTFGPTSARTGSASR